MSTDSMDRWQSIIGKVFLSFCILLLTSADCLSQESKDTSTLTPPVGYRSVELVKLAWVTGQLKTIDRDIPVPESVVVEKNIQYGQVPGTELKLDLYSPRDLQTKVPALIFVHGGGWKSGHRNDYRYYCIKFAELGYVVATISYRLIDVAPFPAAIEDTKCAVRWMRKNAEQHHVDPNRIAILGGSAGGHLSMMAGYSSDVPELEGQGGHSNFSSRVQAVVNLYGPCDLTTPTAVDNKTVLNFFAGKTFDEVPEQYRLASPTTHITPDDPPTLTFHGTIDDIVPIAQADLLDKQLAVAKVSHQYHRLEGWPHTMDLAASVNQYCFQTITNFLAEHLSK